MVKESDMSVEDVASQVQSLMDSWNPPPEDVGMQRLIGVPREPGDGRATASPDDPNLQHPLNPAQKGDAQMANQFADDADVKADDYSGEEWTKEALKDEIDRRNAAMDDEDNYLSKSGNKDDLRQRLVDDDVNSAVEHESE